MTTTVGPPLGPAWLFCPADQPDRFARASACADIVILDLEDGVAPRDKAAARQALIDRPLDPARTVVRINSAGTRDQTSDLEALARTDYKTVMLPKSEGSDQVTALSPLSVVVLVETARGVLRAAELAEAANAVGMMWGAEDLVASLGGGSSRYESGAYRDVARHARSTVLLAARSLDRYALDAVHLSIADVKGLSEEASDAAEVGFIATVCIHPTQVPVVRKAYRPSAAAVEWAERVLAAARGRAGVFSFEGRMVDVPVLRHAEAVLRRFGAS